MEESHSLRRKLTHMHEIARGALEYAALLGLVHDIQDAGSRLPMAGLTRVLAWIAHESERLAVLSLSQVHWHSQVHLVAEYSGRGPPQLCPHGAIPLVAARVSLGLPE